MEKIIDKIIERAKQDAQTIILPEVEDERVLRAARVITDEKIAKVILVGNEGLVRQNAKEKGIEIEDTKIVDPGKSDKFN